MHCMMTSFVADFTVELLSFKETPTAASSVDQPHPLMGFMHTPIHICKMQRHAFILLIYPTCPTSCLQCPGRT